MSQEVSQELESEGLEPSEDFSLDYDSSEGEQEKPENLRLPEDSSSVEQPQTEGEEVAPPQTEEPLSDLETLQRQYNEALGLLNQYKQKELLEDPKTQAQEPQQNIAQQQQQLNQGEVPKLDFLQGRDHIEILQDPEQFNSLLSSVATVAFNAAVQAAQDSIMTRIPEIVRTSAQQQISIENITKDFYSKNPDLANFRQAVSMAAMQLYNENPSLQLPELLSTAAQRTREMLRLTKTNTQQARRPAQPAGGSIRSTGGSRTQQTSQLSDQEQQILDLLNF